MHPQKTGDRLRLCITKCSDAIYIILSSYFQSTNALGLFSLMLALNVMALYSHY
jgi:hypothetical protein